MKKFLKRMNRGLLLGGAILVVLIIYIIVDYSNFSSERAVIKEQLEDYVDEFYELTVKNDLNTLEDYINDTWTGTVVTNYTYNMKKDEILDSLSSFLPSSGKSDTTILSADSNISKISISKCGPNMAMAKLECSATITYKGAGNVPNPFDYMMQYSYSDENNSDIVYEMLLSGDATVYLKKEDGSWKISGSDGYMYPDYFSEAETEVE